MSTLEVISSAASAALPAYLGSYAASWQSRQLCAACPACEPVINLSCPECPAVHCHCAGNSSWSRAEACAEVADTQGVGLGVVFLLVALGVFSGFAFGCWLGTSSTRRASSTALPGLVRKTVSSTRAEELRPSAPPLPTFPPPARQPPQLKLEARAPAEAATEETYWRPRRLK